MKSMVCQVRVPGKKQQGLEMHTVWGHSAGLEGRLCFESWRTTLCAQRCERCTFVGTATPHSRLSLGIWVLGTRGGSPALVALQRTTLVYPVLKPRITAANHPSPESSSMLFQLVIIHFRGESQQSKLWQDPFWAENSKV